MAQQERQPLMAANRDRLAVRSPSRSSTRSPRTGSPGAERTLRHRRSSLVNNIRSAGGLNSIDNFARSWQRAAGFFEITPLRQSYRLSNAGDEFADGEDGYAREEVSGPSSHRSLLRAALQHDARHASEHALEDDDAEMGHRSLGPHDKDISQRLEERRSAREQSIASMEPSLATAFVGSHGSSYGSIGSRVPDTAMRHAGRMFIDQQTTGATEPDKEREPLLVKQVADEDGKVVNVVVGQSTLPQSIFNASNVLIGVGLLSLPLALKYSGWIIGMAVVIFATLTTNYTAKLLAKCLDFDNSLITFADLAYVAFGKKAQFAVSILFTLELLGACVALVVLFADSLHALIPSIDVLAWKIVSGFILVPLAFLPLRLLSFTSILGILCCAGITVALFVDGFIKSEQPGSLLHPAKTYLFPEHWGTVPLSFGLFMSPWGGHSVFPNIYRDMRHPSKYRKAVDITYIGSFLLDISVAVAGILMFGDAVLDEVTSNIFMTKGFPPAVSYFIAICIAIIPLTKIPLNARPIISTVELFLGLDSRALGANSSLVGMSGFTRGLLKVGVRVICQIIFVVIAIAVPSFDRIMTLLGAVACFSICIIVPIAVHLKLFGKELSRTEKTISWILLVVSAIMGTVSTVFALLPKELIGATGPAKPA